jgi:hypothetical protein
LRLSISKVLLTAADASKPPSAAPDGQELFAQLPEAAQGAIRRDRRRRAPFLFDLGLRGGEWIVSGLVLTLGDRASPLVLMHLPERAAHVRERHLDGGACPAVEEKDLR